MPLLFAALLGLPGGGDMDLYRLRRETLEAVPALLQEAAERRPLVVAFEDLQRADPTSLELVGRMIDQVAMASVLLILTCRPGFRPPWGHRAQLTQLRLAPLDGGEIDRIIGSPAAGEELPAEVRERIAERAGGVPLFAEELAREALATERPEDEAVPATLQDLLAVRLDRLGSARDVARIVAGLGSEVSRQRLAAVAALDDASLDDVLDRLSAAGVFAQPGDTVCRFAQELVRDATAASLLAQDKQVLRSRS